MQFFRKNINFYHFFVVFRTQKKDGVENGVQML